MSGDQKRDAGATLVEYALGAALILVVGIGAFNFLSSEATQQANTQAECISSRPPPPGCVRTPVPAPVGPTTTGVAPTTTLTPPSTDPPASTTTTAPPPTSTVVGGPAVSQIIVGDPLGRWEISAPITVTDPGGQPVAGAVVEGRIELGRQPFVVGCTTDAAGTCNITFGPIPAGETSLRLTVVSVQSDPPAALPLPVYPVIPKP
ncbi:MAG: carboxypeptidase-like regulatory domain-containing protein [Acidimicrobiales bacterium]|jgi:Flp pilus assembly pilin Flp|nr:carboxypeptidase-like regulatory domain-containing protein [Acidimicrobiales bacterium]